MIVSAYFSELKLPKTGLSPTIDIIRLSDDSVVVNDQAMSEVGQGFYDYEFTTHDSGEQYVVQCDSVTLTGSERYAIGEIERADINFPNVAKDMLLFLRQPYSRMVRVTTGGHR